MRQLSGVDAAFLAMENARSPMHVGSLGLYSPAKGARGKVDFPTLLAGIQHQVDQILAMQEVLKRVPLNIDQPYWVHDQEYDPNYHIRHIALPHPGTWSQLCELVARLQSAPLDLSRPLWEIYIIEGLNQIPNAPKGSFAMMSKVHHATIDGASGGELSKALHSLEPRPFTNTSARKKINDNKARRQRLDAQDHRYPKLSELLLRAQLNQIKYPFKAAKTSISTLPNLVRTARDLAKGELKRIKTVPRTRFNEKVSSQRVFDSVRFSLDEIKEVKNTITSATINDVALTIVAGGLRAYLDAANELPATSMVAAVPVNLRDGDKAESTGNHVTNMSVLLRTDIKDPLARLRAIKRATKESKALTLSIGGQTLTNAVEYIPSVLAIPFTRVTETLSLSQRMRPMYNCSVTNVPGPRSPLYLGESKMLINFGLGPVMDGVGLFNIINSYCDEFSISFTSCHKLIPDPTKYADCLRQAFHELCDATR